VKTTQQSSPKLQDDFTWQLDSARRVIQVATQLDRDAIFADFFAKAASFKVA
jgi:hypothetical protein